MNITSEIEADGIEENGYDNSFKLKVVHQIEQGEISTFDACLRYGIKDRSVIMAWLKERKGKGFKIKPKKNLTDIKKSLEQRIVKMEIKIRFFELENEILKRKLEFLTKKRAQ